MESELRSIGELARASGLTISALRFYDRCGVLTPALVDPVTGYRWYTDDQVAPARLVAGLRRVGMPLAEITAVVRHRAAPAVVGRLLDAHLRRLEDGLADARRELSRVRALLDPEENPMTTRLVLSRADLAAALDAVRFAVGTDPALPMLSGVLFDTDGDGVRLVATDRHRLAVSRVAVSRVAGPVDGPGARALVPVDLVDRVRALLDTDAPEALLRLDGATVAVTVGDREVSGAVLPYDFPDYARLLRGHVGDAPAYRIPVDVPALRAALAGATPAVVRHDGVDLPVTVLGLDGAGGLRVLDGDAPAGTTPDGVRVGVNGAYLLDALDAGDRGQLVLELDGPIAPLAVRRPDDEDAFSILMPIRL